MWNIVKAELSYVRIPILLSCAFFIVISLINRFTLLITPHDFFQPGFKLLPRMILVHLIIILALLYLEVKEKRPRQLIHLPIPKVQIGIARLATPFVLLLSYAALYVVCFGILLSKFPGQVFELLSYEYRHQVVHSMWDYWFMPQEHWYMTLDQMYVLGWGLLLTYGIRLFSESYGRTLLAIMIVLNIIHGVLLPIFREKLAWQIYDAITHIAFSETRGIFAPTLLAIVLCLLIHVSFMRRKSFYW